MEDVNLCTSVQGTASTKWRYDVPRHVANACFFAALKNASCRSTQSRAISDGSFWTRWRWIFHNDAPGWLPNDEPDLLRLSAER
eukprot:6207884-Pleurochrysis_carterae.AAC.2